MYFSLKKIIFTGYLLLFFLSVPVCSFAQSSVDFDNPGGVTLTADPGGVDTTGARAVSYSSDSNATLKISGRYSGILNRGTLKVSVSNVSTGGGTAIPGDITLQTVNTDLIKDIASPLNSGTADITLKFYANSTAFAGADTVQIILTVELQNP